MFWPLQVVYDTEGDRSHTYAHAWSTDSAQGVIEQYQTGSAILVIVGYGLMMVYAGMAFVNIKAIRKSRMNVGIVSATSNIIISVYQLSFFILLTGGCSARGTLLSGRPWIFLPVWPPIQSNDNSGCCGYC